MDIVKVGQKIAEARKKSGMTQEELADRIGVTTQAVSKWENGHNLPDIANLAEISVLTGTPISFFFDEKTDEEAMAMSIRDQYFQEKSMFTRMRAYAEAERLPETYRALNYMRNLHKEQFRKKGRYATKLVPYINHPLLMACQAHAYGIKDDKVLSAILLHDVVEDTKAELEDLPVSDEVKKIVGLLTFSVPEGMDWDSAKKAYYERIRGNQEACLIKLLDRCNNVSTMAGSFERGRMMEYIIETETYVLPLASVLKNESLEYNEVAFLLKYHIISVIETIKNLIY